MNVRVAAIFSHFIHKAVLTVFVAICILTSSSVSLAAPSEGTGPQGEIPLINQWFGRLIQDWRTTETMSQNLQRLSRILLIPEVIPVLTLDVAQTFVGIGTDTPEKALDVRGEGYFERTLSLAEALFRPQARPANPNNDPMIYFDSTDNTFYAYNGSSWQPIPNQNWQTANGNVFREGGNVGIGTNDPQARLQINQGAGTFVVQSNGNVGISTDDPQETLDVDGSARIQNTLEVAGNIGVGTATPREKLEVNGGVTLGSTNGNTSGTVRWNQGNTDFEGYDGTSWQSLSRLREVDCPEDEAVIGFDENGDIKCASFFLGSDTPMMVFEGNPTTILSGESSVLSWRVRGATLGCEASGGWNGSKSAVDDTPDDETISNIIATTTFTLMCSNENGSTLKSVTVTVSGMPICTFDDIQKGQFDNCVMS